MSKTLIGYVGVDSGQLVICDPCYIDSEWKSKQPPEGHERIKLPDGTIVQFPFAWGTYADVIPSVGKSMNDCLTDGTATRIPFEACHDFSYKGCCNRTNTDKCGGQLVYRLGHEGAGVAVSSGLGDGYYPVYAEYKTTKNWGKRVSRVIIDFNLPVSRSTKKKEKK